MNPLIYSHRSPFGCAFIAALAVTALGCQKNTAIESRDAAVLTEPKVPSSRLIEPGEARFKNMRQLTFGGENAEAYFNGDGTELIFQATRDGFECDQIFRMDVDGRNKHLVSTGEGRTTCSFIFPNQPKILYSSTHAEMTTCPEPPDYSRGYVWRLQPELDIYVAGPDGENPTPLAPHPGYDAEGVLSPQGDRVLFTSTRSGDVDIFSMNPDGTDITQLTDEVGYDGGAFFGPKGEEIVYRAHHPDTPEGMKEYKSLLADNLVRPSVMELFVMDADGSNKRQITNNGAANFAPYFHPDGERIIFSSNMDDPRGRDFDLYLINIDGTGLERVTFSPTFDSFPMFSYDGTKLVFASNRNPRQEGNTNVFVADWVDDLPDSPLVYMEGDAKLETLTYDARVAKLASDEMAGRAPGTEGIELAAQYIEEQFSSIGLVPPPGQESFRQTFEIPLASEIETATLTVGRTEVEAGKGFVPLPFSASTTLDSTDTVFAGYGITAPEHGYDDYADLDVDGEVVVVLRGEPEHRKGREEVFGGADPSRHSALVTKALNARQHGAAGIIVVNDPRTYGGDDGRADALYTTREAAPPVQIPALHMTATRADTIFTELDLVAIQRAIDEALKPAEGKSLGAVSAEVAISQKTAQTANLVGRLPAREDGTPTDRVIVLGAHYDHLGMGGSNSMAPGVEAIHPGADDNASGVAMILELAESLKEVDRAHDIYIVAFSAEEVGLLGSKHFADHLPVDADRVQAMINFDMVGRLRDDTLHVYGVGTAAEFLDMLRRKQIGSDLDLTLNFEGYGPSDHMSFYLEEIPVLSFYTGTHGVYHTPKDTPDTLNVEGAIEVAEFAFAIVAELATTERAPTYVAQQDTRRGDTGGSSRRDYGPYFGSIPGFGQSSDVKGAMLMGAQPDSPAAKAGVQKGDVLVKFGDTDITSLREFAFALRQHSPGDTVEFVVVRDGERVTLTATLGKKERGTTGSGGHGDSEGHGAEGHGAEGHGSGGHGDGEGHHGHTKGHGGDQ